MFLTFESNVLSPIVSETIDPSSSERRARANERKANRKGRCSDQTGRNGNCTKERKAASVGDKSSSAMGKTQGSAQSLIFHWKPFLGLGLSSVRGGFVPHDAVAVEVDSAHVLRVTLPVGLQLVALKPTSPGRMFLCARPPTFRLRGFPLNLSRFIPLHLKCGGVILKPLRRCVPCSVLKLPTGNEGFRRIGSCSHGERMERGGERSVELAEKHDTLP
jgi:hypothetical protein